jgi:hypothetical protein
MPDVEEMMLHVLAIPYHGLSHSIGTFKRKPTLLRHGFGYKVDGLKTRPSSSTILTEHEYLSNSFRSYEGRSGLDLSFPFLCLVVSGRRLHCVGNCRLLIRRVMEISPYEFRIRRAATSYALAKRLDLSPSQIQSIRVACRKASTEIEI